MSLAPAAGFEPAYPELTARPRTCWVRWNLDRYSLRTNESNHPIFKDHSNQQNILYHLRELLFKNNLIYLQFILAPLVGLAPAKLLDENQGTLLICLQRHLIIQQNILYHTLFTLFKIIFGGRSGSCTHVSCFADMYLF